MRPSVILKALLLVALAAPAAQAAPITVSHTVNWTAPSGAAFQTFTQANLPAWSHFLGFDPVADSFVSATLAIRHSGNRDSTPERWFLESAAGDAIAQLDGSSNSSNSFVTETFAIPASLLATVPAASWAPGFKLSAIGSTAEIFLDFATLTVVYNPAVQGPDPGQDPSDPGTQVPEPATLTLLGIVALGFGRRLRNR